MKLMAGLSTVLALVLAGQAQTIITHGAPASVMSPEPDGRQHGVPASVLSPTPLPFGVNPPLPPLRTFRFHGPGHRFGNPHGRHAVLLPIPVFYPIYANYDPYQPADPAVQQSYDTGSKPSAESENASENNTASAEEELRAAYLQGARDALKQQAGDARYGEHYLDSREAVKPSAQPQEEQPAPVSTSTESPSEDSSPATVFIFKNGTKLETRNFAIVGQTLYDFSGTILKKVQLGDLDRDATTKANDDRGIVVKLP
jgi:hypothetical protein